MSNKAQTPADIRGWNINKSSCLGLSVHVIFCLFPCVGHTWGLSPLSSTLLHKTCGDIAAAKPLPHLFHWLEVDLKHFLNWLEAGEVQTEAPMYRASRVECGFPRKPGPIHDWHFCTWGISFTLSCLSDSFCCNNPHPSQCSSSPNAALMDETSFYYMGHPAHEHTWTQTALLPTWKQDNSFL